MTIQIKADYFRFFFCLANVDSLREEDETANQVAEHARHHHHDLPNHTEGKCEFCDYMRVKRLLEHLNR